MILPRAEEHLDGVDASPGGCSTPPPWHIDAVGGRPHHQGVPDDDLPDRETGDDILPVLQQPTLYPPFVVVEDRTILGEDAHHCAETLPLPGDVLVVRHAVVMVRVAALQGGILPLATAPVLKTVPCRIA